MRAVKVYPKAKGMTPEQAAEELIQLEDEKKIIISFNTAKYQILCNINWIT